MKKCSKCHNEKPESEFAKDPRYAGGLKAWCRQCTREYERERRHRDIESQRAMWRDENRRRAAAKRGPAPAELPHVDGGDVDYLAGFTDAEGTISSRMRGKAPKPSARFILVNTAPKVLDWYCARWDARSYTEAAGRTENAKPLRRSELSGNAALAMISLVRPRLVGKADVADAVLAAQTREDVLLIKAMNERGQPGEHRPFVPVDRNIEPTANDVSQLAGLVDGDGLIGAYHDGSDRRVEYLGSNADNLEWVQRRFGGSAFSGKARTDKHRIVWHVYWGGDAAMWLLRGIFSYLKEKHRQAEILFALSDLKYVYAVVDGQPRRVVPEETMAKRAILLAELHELNRRGISPA